MYAARPTLYVFNPADGLAIYPVLRLRLTAAQLKMLVPVCLPLPQCGPAAC